MWFVFCWLLLTIHGYFYGGNESLLGFQADVSDNMRHGFRLFRSWPLEEARCACLFVGEENVMEMFGCF